MKKLLAIVMLCGLGFMATSAFSNSTAPTSNAGVDVCFGPFCG